jgi:hypothetical protein
MLAALLVFAVVLWRRPAASSALLAAAGWFKLAPFALVPVWLAPLRGRRLLSAVGALAGVSVAMLALLLALGGVDGLSAMVKAMSFQFSRGSPQSAWAVLGIERLQPLAQASVLALVGSAAVRRVVIPIWGTIARGSRHSPRRFCSGFRWPPTTGRSGT